MMGNQIKIVLFIVKLIVISTTINAFKLNVPRVLLPIFNEFAINFTLEATEGGCYKWSTTRNDIIQIIPIDEQPESKCSNKVQISAVTKEKIKNMAIVLAEDLSTGETLRCDVIVDAIHELRIKTTTKELFMEEAPEDFEVKAYDDQGNEFSSLEGIEFEWIILSFTENKEPILQYIPFENSPYKAPPVIESLEKQFKKGNIVLLEGVKSGTVKVSVRLPLEEYQHLPTCEVQLMVVANVIIVPSDVYIMVGDTITFQFFYLKNGRMEEIDLYISQYQFKVENEQVATCTEKLSSVTGIKEGDTKIRLHDVNLSEDDVVLKLPEANMHVVKPDFMLLKILPHKNWAILVADHYEISAELYTADDHKIYIGEAVLIHINLSLDFAIIERSSNGSWLLGYGMKPTIAPVQASLESIVNDKVGVISLDKSITAKSDLMIYPRISINPSEVMLPWDSVIRPSYEVTLTATGGDGRFMWTSTNNSIGMVSQYGLVRTLSNGVFEVAAIMLRNHYNRAATKIFILPPSRLEIIEFLMETEIGSSIHLYIALYAEQEKNGQLINVPFTQCQDLPFQVRLSDSKFQLNRTESLSTIGVSCGSIVLDALEIGTSKVTVTYFHNGRALEDSVSVTAFKALTIFEPKADIVLAVGTSTNIIYTGGPRPGLKHSNAFQPLVVSDDETIATVEDITTSHTIGMEYTVVQVVCLKIGKTHAKMQIQNIQKTSSSQRQTHVVQTRISCATPREIILQPEIKVADTNICPLDLESSYVIVHSNTSITLDVSVYDESGLKFLNITSLSLVWNIDPYGSAKIKHPDGLFENNLEFSGVPIAFRMYQILETTVEKGTMGVNVSISGYNKAKSNIPAEYPPFITLEDKHFPTYSLRLYLVQDAVISPNYINIFNHPGNKVTVSVEQGSGFFEMAMNTNDIVTAHYSETDRTIEITPIRSGEVTVQVIDLCLVSRPTYLAVNVISVGIIRIEMIDKVEIRKCINTIVRLYDENDNLMDLSDNNIVNLRPHLKDNIVNIYLSDKHSDQPWGFGETHYTITGVEVGDTKLMFLAKGNEDIYSAPVNLQVFEPLALTPKNGSIIINSNVQIVSKGGPSSDVKLVFETTSKNLKVSEQGVITGKYLGPAVVIGRAVGIHPFTGQSIVYAEDHVDIQVVKLTGVKIMAPLTRFKLGVMVPFWAWGIPNISPMILGSFHDPPIMFKWDVDDKLMLDLSGIFHPIGVFKKKLHRIAIKVQGIQVGKTKLFVHANVPGTTCNVKNLDSVTLSAWIEVEVIPEFILTTPKSFPGNPLLIAPFSELQLNTNLHEIVDTEISYVLLEDRLLSTESELDYFSNTNVTLVSISRTGLLKSYGILGQTWLVVTGTDKLGLKQRLSIVVEVKAIHYMNLVVNANWRIHSDSPLRTVPLGTEFVLRATFHDDMGNTFNAGPKDLHLRTSRCDLLKIEKINGDAAVIIQTKQAGSTVIKGWAEGIQQTADYLKVQAEQSVRPIFDSLTSGDIICLWTPVVNEYNMPGTWKSNDDSLMHINPALDIGFVGKKEGVVVLTHSLLKGAPIYIQIYTVSEIEFLESPRTILTNAELDTVIRIPLVLQNPNTVGIKTNNLIQGWRCRTDVRKLVRPTGFKCFIEFSNSSLPIQINDLFNVTTSWVPDTGQYACKIINLGVSGPDISMLKTDVIMWATTEDSDKSSKKIKIRFLPGVYLPHEIILDGSLVGKFLIIGLPEVLEQVEVHAADESILYIAPTSAVNSSVLEYKVNLIDYHWRLENLEEAMGIFIISPITKQEIKVLVKVAGDLQHNLCMSGRSRMWSFLQTYKYALCMTTLLILIFYLTFYFYSTYMQPIVNVNVPTSTMLTSNLQASTQVSCRIPSPCAALRAQLESRQCAAHQLAITRRTPIDQVRYSPRYGNNALTSSTCHNTNCPGRWI
ncbi:nuclear pore membrane glycoprotein 210 [Diabrotica virgifera virgifera]|uniref:Nuclear pore membrane glycoprotein 210 n=1 Tax=Diabrotica virgifera virgifera TaxID=50390 RepID=A0A6P7FT43_DIAVI|nr:nuclear pore membrane glycoprotein 210 [Diabrotica virgifera virgifera]